jgi:hypothetical protein
MYYLRSRLGDVDVDHLEVPVRLPLRSLPRVAAILGRTVLACSRCFADLHLSRSGLESFYIQCQSDAFAFTTPNTIISFPPEPQVAKYCFR